MRIQPLEDPALQLEDLPGAMEAIASLPGVGIDRPAQDST